MRVIVDTGVLVAAADRRDPHHAEAAQLLIDRRGSLVVTELVVSEADYLVGTRAGREARLRLAEDLGRGLIELTCLSASEIAEAASLDRHYGTLDLGITDASIIVTAHRYATREVATFDERCFRAVTPIQGGTFTLLPADLA